MVNTKKQAGMKTPQQNLAKVLKGKKVLFIENDRGLYNGLEEIEKVLIKNKITYECLFNVQDVEFSGIVKKIKECDAIIFQTTWIYEISRKIKEFMYSLQEKKIVIECYISEPSWYYKPEGAIHDLYICNPSEEDRTWKEWEFYKLSDEPYWDYKNKFDK